MLSRRRLRCYQSEMDLSSSAAALLAGDVPVQVRHFPLRGGEKLLELVLEGQIAGGGGVRCLNGGPPGSRRGTGDCCRTGLEAPLGGALRCRQRLFDGKIQLSVLDSKELYLNVLPLLQEIMDIVDIGIGDLEICTRPDLPPSKATKAPNFVILVTLPSKTVPTSYSISAVLLLFLFLLK